LKYVQPYGVSDPNASYINGDPSTGTMGSIPPAASIEHPQREIVNFITKCGITPSTSDLLQLAKAVQSGFINFGVDDGDPNEIEITPAVPIASYKLGQRFAIKVANGNTGPTTVNISGVGPAPLIHTDLSPMNAYELVAGQLIEVAYDGESFQVLAGASAGAVTMVAPQHLYVNATTGSDTLYDGSSPVVSGAKAGPFKTIAKALATMSKYNLGGWTFTIHVADGNYHNAAPVEFPAVNGSGKVILSGNVSNPLAVSIMNTGTGSAWRLSEAGSYIISGFRFRTTAAAGADLGAGIICAAPAGMTLGKCDFGQCSGQHIVSGPGAYCGINGDITISGGAIAHLFAWVGSSLLVGADQPGDPNLTITNPVNITNFVQSSECSTIRPIYGVISGAANVTGKKYVASGNGIIQTRGRAVTYLPGDAAGTLATGGQYL